LPCYDPSDAFLSPEAFRNPKTGKRIVKFSRAKAYERGGHQFEKIKVHCGTCEGCRIDRSRQWAVRCWHESNTNPNQPNSFLTLTFRNACPIATLTGRGRYQKLKAEKLVDPTESLHLFHFQDFMKRLRKRFYGNSKSNIKYFHCGEYGEKFGRPHHHACLFNFEFPDKELKRKTDAGCYVYTSKILSELWPHGIHEIGDVTYQSAAYVARYILKKMGGWRAKDYYLQKKPEYITMSRNPAIALEWFNQFKTDVYPSDYVTMENGAKCLPPKYYDRRYELEDPETFALLKQKRVEKAKADPNNTPERLAARREIVQRRLKRLKRGYESET